MGVHGYKIKHTKQYKRSNTKIERKEGKKNKIKESQNKYQNR